MQQTKSKLGLLLRLYRQMFRYYPVLLPLSFVLIIFNAVVRSIPSIFMQNVIEMIEEANGAWADVSPRIIGAVALLAGFYVISLIADFAFSQMMAVITQERLQSSESRCSQTCKSSR